MPTSSDAAEIPPSTEPTLRAVAMPADTNPHGDIFGGWLLCQMDLAGTIVATRRARGRVVTVAITGMTFHRPVMVGDEVTCFGSTPPGIIIPATPNSSPNCATCATSP